MGDTSLRVWVMPTDVGTNAGERLTQALQRMHPELQEYAVEWRIVPWNTARLELLRAYKRGQLPDVFQIGTTWFSSFAYLDCLSEPPADIQEIPVVAPWMKEVCRYRGVQYAVPWIAETTSFQVRPDIMERLSISEQQLHTWDGFLDACTEIQLALEKVRDLNCEAPIGIPSQPNSGTLHRLAPWLWGGGWNLTKHGEWLTDDGIEPALRLLGELISLEQSQLQLERTHIAIDNDYFQNGRYAFMTGTWLEVIRSKMNQDLSFSSVPTKPLPMPLGPAGIHPFAGGSVLAVSAESPKIELAWEFVRRLISSKTTMYWASITGLAPMREGGFWDIYANDLEMQIMKSSLQAARYYPKEELWVHIETLLNNGISDLMWILSRDGYSEASLKPVRRDYDDKIKRLLELNWGIV